MTIAAATTPDAPDTEPKLDRELSLVSLVFYTPTMATATVAAFIVVLVEFFPIVELARMTSLLTLAVFTAVNLSLYVIGRREPTSTLGRYRWVGLTGAVLSFAVAAWHVATELF